MNTESIIKVCFYLCIICIVVGAVIALAAIWGSITHEQAWRPFLSLCVLFCSSALVMHIIKMYLSKK